MKPDYGLDAPKLVRNVAVRGGLLTAFAIGLWIANGPSSQPLFSIILFIGICFLATSGIMYWSSRVGKLKARDRILDGLPWRGDEKVLDVGCGRGLLLIGAAKRLKSGRATGVDIWSQDDLSGNSPDATRANAKAEGVADKIKIETADARKLSFPDASFDTVLSGLAIHNIATPEERETALGEIVRVLKPGGRLALFDIFHSGEYAKVLQKLGLADVQLSGISFLWCVPTRTLTARKP